MTWIQQLPVQNRNQTASTSALAWPQGATLLEGRIDCTTGDPANPFTGFNRPFNSQAMFIDWNVEVSYDGGTTFLHAAGGHEVGSVAGFWGKQMFPYGAIGPFDATKTNPPPTHYRASINPGQQTTYGVSIQVT